MRVYVYEALDREPPKAQRYIARIWCEMIGKGNKPAMGWHPVLFHGASAEGVREQAQSWWDKEVTAAREKAENIARGAKKRAEKRAAA